MRTGILGLLSAAVFVVHGQTAEMNGALMRQEVTVPAWLSIPESADVVTVNYSGGPGAEQSRGSIRVLTDGDAPELVGSMMTRLALDGFVIGERHFHGVTASRVRTMISASNPSTGQSATVAYLAGLSGEELRINFVEMAAQ